MFSSYLGINLSAWVLVWTVEKRGGSPLCRCCWSVCGDLSERGQRKRASDPPRSHTAPAVIAAHGPRRNCEKNAPMSSAKCVSPPLRAEGLKWVKGSNRIGSSLLLGATEEG